MWEKKDPDEVLLFRSFFLISTCKAKFACVLGFSITYVLVLRDMDNPESLWKFPCFLELSMKVASHVFLIAGETFVPVSILDSISSL